MERPYATATSRCTGAGSENGATARCRNIAADPALTPPLFEVRAGGAVEAVHAASSTRTNAHAHRHRPDTNEKPTKDRAFRRPRPRVRTIVPPARGSASSAR